MQRSIGIEDIEDILCLTQDQGATLLELIAEEVTLYKGWGCHSNIYTEDDANHYRELGAYSGEDYVIIDKDDDEWLSCLIRYVKNYMGAECLF